MYGSCSKMFRDRVKVLPPRIEERTKLFSNTFNSMQNWFGIAICQNSADLYQMKSNEMVRYCNSSEFCRLISNEKGYLSNCITFKDKNDDYHHGFYSPGQLTCCKYQQDKLATKTTHKNKINIPEWIFDIVKTIFEYLSNDLLTWEDSKLQIKSFGVNAKKCFCTKDIGVNSAVIQFNDVVSAISSLLAYCSLKYCVSRKLSKKTDRRSVCVQINAFWDEVKVKITWNFASTFICVFLFVVEVFGGYSAHSSNTNWGYSSYHQL